jgi:hypothetical protein
MLFSPWLSTFRHKARRQATASRRHLARREDRLQMRHSAELLEARTLLTSPEFVSVSPNVGEFLRNGDVRTESPQELLFQFSPGQDIDSATLGAIQLVAAGHDGSFRPASALTDFGTSGAVTVRLGTQRLGAAENGSTLSIATSDFGVDAPPTIAGGPGALTLTLNSNTTTPTTVQDLLDLVANDASAAALLTVEVVDGDVATDISGASGATLTLGSAGAADVVTDLGTGTDLRVQFAARSMGLDGNDITVQINRSNLSATTVAPQVTVTGNRIEIVVNDGAATTAQAIVDAIAGDADANTLVSASVAVGDSAEDVSGVQDGTLLRLSGADRAITPGFVDVTGTTNEVIYRFAETLPDDAYRIQILGTGASPLQNTGGEAFEDGADYFQSFSLELGSQTTAVVPQPVLREQLLRINDEGGLTSLQDGDTITIDPNVANFATATTDLESAGSGGGEVTVVYEAVQQGAAGNGVQVTVDTDDFGEFGTPTVSVVGQTVLVTLNSNVTSPSTAQDLADAINANLSARALVDIRVLGDPAFVLGSSLTGPDVQVLGGGFDLFTFEINDAAAGPAGVRSGNIAIDVDLTADDPATVAGKIATEISNATLSSPDVEATAAGSIVTIVGGSKDVRVTTTTSDADAITERAGGLVQRDMQVVVYFNDDDLDITSVLDPDFYQLIDTNGAAAGLDPTLDHTTDTVQVPDSVIFDKSARTSTLIFNSGIAGGTYRLRVGVSDLPVTAAPLTLSPADDDNSSFATATDLTGALGLLSGTEFIVSSQIEPQPIPLPPLPGGLDEPGHRHIQVEAHVGASGTTPVAPGPITVYEYNFADVIGSDPQGNPLYNLITEEEKDRAREIFEIYAYYLGVEFVETPSSGLQVATGDMRAIEPTIPVGPDEPLGLSESAIPGRVIMDPADTQGSPGADQYGGVWFGVALHEIGHSLGLGHSYDLPSTQGPGLPNNVYTGDHDFVHALRLFRDDSTDIDMYQVDIPETGVFSAEIFAERLTDSSLLNSAISLFDVDGNVIARNDDYFSNDAFLELELEAGTYFVGVTSTGNLDYDATVSDSGSGGTTDGDYELHLNFLRTPQADEFLADAVGTAFDGDADGQAGGAFDFWFQATDTSDETLFVDKTAVTNLTSNLSGAAGGGGGTSLVNVADVNVFPEIFADPTGFAPFDLIIDNEQVTVIAANPTANQLTVMRAVASTTRASHQAGAVVRPVSADGTIDNPFGVIEDALVDADTRNTDGSATNDIDLVRIVGNGGADNDLGTIADSRAYLVGFNDSGDLLEDGAEFIVPQGVTVMIDQGAVLKLQNANIEVGSSSDIIDRSGAALQLLGTPDDNVVITTNGNDAIGGDTDGVTDGANPGDWGGLVFRNDSDYEADGVFLNFVGQSDISYGGGLVNVDSVQSVYSPVHAISARPTVMFNTITFSADAGISANPNSFEEGFFVTAGMPNADYTLNRVGPDIHGNVVTDNTLNGLFVRVDTQFGKPIDKVDVAARFDDTDIVHIITENVQITGNPGGPLVVGGVRTARLSGKLQVDEGTVVKLAGSRIEAEHGGGDLIIEGSSERPVILTSIYDDTYGAGGTFDTSDNGATRNASAGDWGGLILNAGSSASIDNAYLAYGGGLVPIEGNFDNFNLIEVRQAGLRLTNSFIENNANGRSSSDRNGRGSNDSTTIYINGAQPIIVNNDFTGNSGSVISINANSLIDDIVRDPGRSTGTVDAFSLFPGNQGPLIRLNAYDNNSMNGMEVRGETITTSTVWDDTDIVHILRSEVLVPDFHTSVGVRLESSNTESLVVKLSGDSAGFTATGRGLDIDDRIGGIVQIVGQPLQPVVLTSLLDDTIGAGFRLDGLPQSDTNNDLDGTSPSPGDWRSVRLEQFSHDRNVDIRNEAESVLLGGTDANRTPLKAELLGDLAPDENNGDENRRLGFEIYGAIAADSRSDVDVYSFRADAGSEVWIDLDETDPTLNSVVELVDALGRVLVRSSNPTPNNNVVETFSAGSNPPPIAYSLTKDDRLGGDFYTSNPNDAGFRVILPGVEGTTGTFFVRVRSNSGDLSNVTGGETTGYYKLQVRVNQVDDEPGSTIRNADIRYATDGIEVFGLPVHSPLLGESAEDSTANNTVATAQALGNMLTSDRNTISVAGSISSLADVDFYQFQLGYEEVQSIGGVNDGGKAWSNIFDIDWADGLSRPDTTIAVYDSTGSLILVSRDSNIEDDQAGAGQGNDFDDLSRGSAGELDPFIGSVMMPAGTPGSPITYYVAVSHSSRLPTALNATFAGNSSNTTVRLEPVSSITRVVEDHIGFSGYSAGDPSLGTIQIDPVTPTILDISDSMTLSTHVTPFTFGDVQLFVDSGGVLLSVNPQTGATNYAVDVINGSGVGYGDIAMRWDGVLLGQTAFGNTATGNYRAIDPGSATQINLGDDGFGINPNNNGTGTSWDALAFSYNTNDDTFDGWAFNNRANDNDDDGTNGIGNQAGLYEINANTGVAVDENGNVAGHQAFRSSFFYTGLNGDITGMAFTGITGGTLLGVDDEGNLWNMFGGTRIATNITGLGVGFTGLTNGPQNLLIDLDADGADDSLANVFFATGDDGQLWAFDSTGALFNVWDTDGDLMADSPSLDLGLGAGTRGVAFSTLDYNLWHPTMNRSGDAGHGVNDAFDLSRNPGATSVALDGGRSSNEGAGGASFYFGMETWQNNNTNVYFDYGVNAQYGVQSQNFQRAATSGYRSGTISGSVVGGPIQNTYNFPGGAFGSLTTNPFSLEDYDSLDRPTLYFNYFIETQSGAGTLANGEMRDAARVLVSTDGGASYSLLTTNNSIPDQELPALQSVNSQYTTHAQQRVQELFDDGSDTDGWRQARVDLGDFAGQSNLLLRFDFTTAGSASTPGDITSADASMPGETNTGSLASENRGQANDFEGFYIDDIIIGFAERGEMVTNATSGLSSYYITPDDPDSEEVTAGTYQLELRRGTEYGANLTEADPEIFVFPIGDTNTRLTQEATFFAPSGAAIADGNVFSISDGVHTIEFEFDNDSSVGTFDLHGVATDRIAISFDSGVSAGAMANRVAAAVNDVNNQLPQLVPDFDVIASSISTSDQVELAGAISIDATFTPVNVTIDVVADEISENGGTSTVTVTREDPTFTFAGDLVVDLFAEDIPQGVNVGTSFTMSTQFSDSGFIPPDTMAAVGTTQIVESINGNFQIFDKSGASLASTSQANFWETVQAGFGNGQFDPRIVFDPTWGATGRWIATAIDRGTAGPAGRGGNSIYIAVSDDDTLETDFSDWTAVSFVGDTIDGIRFNDYDTLGLDATGVYIGTNNFDGPSGFDVSLYSIPKDDLLTGDLSRLSRFEALSAGTYGSTLQPAVDFGADDGRGTILSTSGSGRLTRFDVIGADDAGATLSAPVTITVPAYSGAPQGRQPGPNDNIENVSPRITSNVMEVGGSLWAVHAVADPTFGGSAIRWYEIDEATNSLLQTGLINDPNLDFYDASIAVNPSGDVVIGFSGSGDAQFISAYAVSGTTSGGITTFGVPQLLQAGASEYTQDYGTGRVRWGDYSATVVDPTDPNVFWTFQEFANSGNRWSINASQVSLGSSGSDELEILDMPAGSVITQITIPDGMASATFTVSGLDDGVVDGTRSVLVSGVASGYTSVTDVVDVLDDEIATLTVTISGATNISEAGPGTLTGEVSRNTPTDGDLVVTLLSSDTSEASVPAMVTIPAGQPSVTFDITPVDDIFDDGDQPVTISASAYGFVSVGATVTIEDDADTTPSGSPSLSDPMVNVDGLGFSFVDPPDTVGAVGPTRYVQAINAPGGTSVRIFNKTTGAPVGAAFDLDTLAAGATGGTAYDGDGDPIVLYDDLADRWLLLEFETTNDQIHMFISDGATPTSNGADWTQYFFDAPNLPDYPKITMWPDAYFIGTNEVDTPVYALDRVAMLAGTGGDITASVIRMSTPDLPNWQRNHIMPADLDGAAPPAGAPGIFVRQVDDEYTAGASTAGDFLEIWEFDPDFATPANSTYTLATTVSISDFDYIIGDEFGRGDIEQPGTATELDALPHYLGYRLQYRNFGTYETLVGTFTVDVNEDATPDGDGGSAAEQAGVRWFELRDTGSGWTLYQEGEVDFADGDHRWMASAAMDGLGNIAIGYSVASSTTSPGIRYSARTALDTLGTLQPEKTLINGTGNVDLAMRWGDYSALTVDPSDDTTFWYTTEYADGTGAWNTRIGSFTMVPGNVELQVDITPDSVFEDDGLVAGTVTRTGDTTNALTVTLSSSDTSELIPFFGTVTIPAGQPSATFFLDPQNDGFADGTQTAVITASASGFVSITDSVDVLDAQTQQLTLSIDPDTAAEDVGVRAATGTVSRNTELINEALTVYLVSTDESEIAVPATVVIPAGERSTTFYLDTLNELTSDGTRTVNVFATSPGFRNGSDTIDVEADAFNASIFDRLGDKNLHRDQGALVIRGNTIDSAENDGIHIDFGPRDTGTGYAHPGSPRNLPTLNSSNLSRGVTIENNIVSKFGSSGIFISGDPDSTNLPQAALPFAKVVNNTIVGNPTASGSSVIDVVFLIDNTFSMGPIIDGIKQRLLLLDNALTGANVDAAYGAVRFPDNAGEPVQIQDITDFATFSATGGPFDSIQISGAREPGSEAVLEGLNEFDPQSGPTTFSFRPGARPVMLLVSTEDDDSQDDQAAAQAALLANNALFFGIVDPTFGTTVADYTPFATSTGGQLFDAADFTADPDAFFQTFIAALLGSLTTSGAGITIEENASPTLLNNIVANTATGISVDATSTSTVVGTTLYQNNSTNANFNGNTAFLGSNAIVLQDTDPLFVSPATGNYYLATGSLAIDSSLNTLGDRPALTSVTDTIGIVPSDIFAPDYDIFGQLRRDEPAQSPPPGLGSDIFKDRGAVERVDFIGGVASLFVPLDNGDNASTGPDLDPATHVAHIDSPPFFNQFVVKLSDAGIGIDDGTVVSSGRQFSLTETTRLGTRTLVGTFTGDPNPPANLDYFFTYNTNTNEAILTSVTLFDTLARYQITVDNDPLSGIRDLAGNALVANQGDGTVKFDILVTAGPNIPPVNTLPTALIEVDENVTPFPSSLALSAANGYAITVDDVDAFLGTNELSVTLTVSNDGSPQGTLTLPTGSAALVTFLQGAENTPSGVLEIVGDIADLNTVLDGLVFTPRLNYTGLASLTVETNDLGNFGFPRDDDMTDIDVINFNIVEAVLPPGFTIDLPDAAPSGPLTVTEAGSMDTFEVVLLYQPLPGREVFFTITTDDASETSVTSSISFDEFDWNTPKTVTVTGVNDDFDDGDITSVITVAVDDMLTTDRRYRDDVRAPAQTVDVITTDDEEAGFTVDLLDAAPTGPLTVSEDGGVTDTFTVVLDARPAIGTQVVLTLTPSDSGEASVDQATVTFDDTNWDMPQTVTVTGVNDDFDDGNIASLITVAVDTVNTSAPAFLDPNQSDLPLSIAPQTIDVVTTDDDEADFTIDLLGAPGNILTVSEDGTLTDTFTVVLNAQPIAGTQVVISITPDDLTEVNAIASLTFDTNNWDTPQTVTVTGSDDDLDEGNVMSTLNVAVDTMNTDAPAFLDPNQGDAPAAVAPQTVNVTTLDDDEANFTIDLLGAPGNILTVSEDGVTVTDTFTVVLDTQPATGTIVVLLITPTDATEVSTPVSISFDEFDWDTPKTVTATGVDDFFDDGDDPSQITVSVDTVNTTAPAYLDPNQSDPPPSVAPQTLDIVTTDDDEADFTIDLLDAAPSGPLTVSEDGTTTVDTFTVVLNARPIPGTQVVLSITPNDPTEVSTTMSLTFDTNDWDTPQTVTVTGVDDFLDEGDVLSTVTVSVDTVNTDAPAFLDPNQADAPASVASQDVSVLTVDDDEAGFTIDLLGAAGGVLTVSEDEALFDTFTVVLDTQPEPGAQVWFTLNANDASEASVAPFLMFDEFDWDTPKTVTVNGVDDFFDDDDIASTLTVAVDTLRTTSPTYLDPNQGDPPAFVAPQDINILTLDDDTAGILIDELDGVSVAESGTMDSFEVTLSAQPLPGTVVVVTYTSGDTGEATVNPASFTFNTNNWSIPRTVMVTGVDDDFDDGDILSQITVSVDDGLTSDPAYLDPGKTPDQFVDVTTTDDDTADFTIDLLDSAPAGRLSVSEDGTLTDSFTVVLNARPIPGTQVVLSIASSDPSEVSATASLTFDSNDWDTPQTVSVAGLDDFFDDGDINSQLTVAVDTVNTDAPAFLDPDQGAPPAMVAAQTVDVRTIDDDTAGFTLDLLGAPADVLIVSEDGTQTDSFTIVLDAQPLPGTQVTLSIAPTDATEGETMSSPVTFDTNTWNMPQTVTISGVDDIDVDGDITAAFTVSIVAGMTTDPAFNDPGKTPAQSVAFTNLDDEVAEFDIVESGGSSLVAESGTTDTFTVVLRDRPLTNVTLSVTSTDTGEVSVDKSTLTFTPTNWDQPQTVTVTGVDEPTVDGDQIIPVRVEVIPGSSHPLFHTLLPKDIDVTVTDDDIASFSVTEPVDGTFPVTTVSESRTSDTLAVVLGAQPETDVVLTVMISDPTEATLNAAQLRFTFANWNIPQQIVVTGVDDPVVDGPQTSMLTVAINPALTNDFFDALAPQMFDVTTLDNDSGRFLVSSPTSSTVSEDGTSATFLVVLQDQPATDVVLDVATDDATETSVDQPTLTFTSMNWNQPQTVTVTGVDDAIIDGTQRSMITVSVNTAATDDQFDGALPASLSFNTTDNDVAGFTVTESDGSTTVDESGTTDTFAVVLDTAPSSDVVFSVTVSNADEATVDLGMLTFTPMTWAMPQTITVTGVDDDVVDGTALSNVTISVVDAASNIAFRSLADATVSVSTTDDEVPGFTITESSGSSEVSESGSTDSFTVVLDAKPQSDVVLTVSSSDIDSLSATPGSLTFTPDNWDTPQTVDLAGLDDGIVNGNRNVDVVVAVETGASDAGFSAVGSQTVSALVTDDDVPGILINGPMGGLEVNENGSTDTFTVELTAQPLTDVVLDVTSSDPGEASASPAQLTFTPDNWNSPQAVTVTGVDDMDDDGDQVSQISVTVNAGGSDPLYVAAATQMTPVTTFDDDSIELSVTLQAATGLIVGTDGSGDVLITLTGDGLAVVEGTVNGVPVAGPYPASEISRLVVTGSDEANSIDLSGVLPADFTFVSGLVVNVNSGRGNDVITGSPFGDFIVGAAGNDVINSGDGDDTVFGGAGKDALNGGAGNDSLSGQGGTGDSLTGGAGDDFLDGGAGNDLIMETVTGNLTLTNTTMVGLGNDTVVGLERANLQGGGAANVIDASAFFTPGLTSVSLYGGGGNDELIGSPGNDVLSGQGGNDTVLGGGGADRVFGGSGADRLNGQDGNDMVFGQGGSGDWLTGGAGDDLLNGGSGVDRLVESGAVGFVLTNSSLDGNGSDTLLAIESASLSGGAGDDVIDASAFSLSFVIVSGGAGNDTLIGGDTLNILNGRDGDDTLIGGPRNDKLRGNDGNDLIEGGDGNDVLEGGDGDDTLLGQGGDDTIDGGRGADGISGADGNDVLQGWKGADLVLGGSGNDTLEGDDGNDTLIGGVGDDDLAGQNGVDVLVRGNGTDPAEPGDIVDDLSEVDDVFMLMPFPGWIDTI